MIILHVLTQFAVTGAEVYAATLADRQCAEGHEVHIVSPYWHTETKATIHAIPMGQKPLGKRGWNVLQLAWLIKSINADIIHAHSRASSWVAHFATRITKTPFLSTVHGRQHIHPLKPSFDCYGQRIIAVCDALKIHLVEEMGYRKEKIKVIPNGIDFNDIQEKAAGEGLPKLSGYSICIAGRTSGPKGERTAAIIEKCLPHWLKEVPNLNISIVGGSIELLNPSAQEAWSAMAKEYPQQLHWYGTVPDLAKYLKQSDLVIGSGRVAMEAVALGKVTLAFGESCYVGFVNAENYQEAFATNFGDIKALLPLAPVSWSQVQADVLLGITAKLDESIRRKIITVFDAESVYQQIQQVYESLIWQSKYPKHIPVLMYHKIPEKPSESQHRIFVTKGVFAKHIQYLKQMGYKSLTFQEYDDYRNGKLPAKNFPKKPVILTFDDGYKDNLVNALPIMKAAGFKGVLFILADRSHTDNFWDVAKGETSEPLMTHEELLLMQKAGWELGAHTFTHSDLTTLSPTDSWNEIANGKQRIESEFSQDVISFAYPYGKFNEEVKEQLLDAGYKYAVVIDAGGLHLEEDPLEIFRVYMFPEDGLLQIRKKAASWYRAYFRKKRGR